MCENCSMDSSLSGATFHDSAVFQHCDSATAQLSTLHQFKPLPITGCLCNSKAAKGTFKKCSFGASFSVTVASYPGPARLLSGSPVCAGSPPQSEEL